MNLSKMSRSELIEMVEDFRGKNEAWVEKCASYEAQLACSRLVLQPIYNRFKVEDEGCECELCDAMRTLFEKPGGRALVEEFREQRLAIEEALQILAGLMANDGVNHGKMRRCVTWLTRLSGRKMPGA